MKILVVGGTGLAGRVFVERALAAGHDVRVLSRSASATTPAELVGGDLITGAGLPAAVAGVEAVVDLSNVNTLAYRKAGPFFTTAIRNLVRAEQAAGVRQHVLISITGVDAFPGGYYRAKVDQERALTEATQTSGLTPTIVRVTQFHDYAAQVYRWFRLGPVVGVPPLHLRPVHLADVAEHLLGLLGRADAGRAPDLSGPAPLDLVDMVRAYAARQERPARLLRLPLPPATRRANQARVLAPAAGAHGTRTFDQWLDAVTDP